MAVIVSFDHVPASEHWKKGSVQMLLYSIVLYSVNNKTNQY